MVSADREIRLGIWKTAGGDHRACAEQRAGLRLAAIPRGLLGRITVIV
jgi:hypothetical protein